MGLPSWAPGPLLTLPPKGLLHECEVGGWNFLSPHLQLLGVVIHFHRSGVKDIATEIIQAEVTVYENLNYVALERCHLKMLINVYALSGNNTNPLS